MYCVNWKYALQTEILQTVLNKIYLEKPLSEETYDFSP